MLKEGTFTKKKYIDLLICSILGWIVCILGGMADSIIAGLFLDSEAVSAVELIYPLGTIIEFFSFLIGLGFPLMYSVALGSLNVERSGKIAGMGVFVAVVLGIVMAVLMVLCKNVILDFYGCTGQLYEYASQYYDPLIFLALVEPLTWSVYYLVNYDGDARLILVIDIMMAVSNAVISLLLVGRKGIEGLAIGTTVSYIIGLLFTVPHFFKKSNSIHFRFHFSWRDLFQSVKLSSSTSLTTLYIAVVDVAFNKFIIDRFGQNMLPAYTVVNTVMNFASILLCTMSAGNVFVTIAYGEKNNYAIRRTMKLVHRSMFIISIAFSSLVILAASAWPDIYGITDPAVAKAAVFAGRLVPATYIFAAVTFNYISFYPSVARPLEGNILSIAYMLLGPVVLALPLGLIGGFNAMSVGFALTPVFSLAVLFVWCLIRGEAKKFPYLLPDDTEINAHYDLRLENESITKVRDAAGSWLAGHKVDAKTAKEVQTIIEETLFRVKSHNKKTVYCECELLLNDDHVRIIIKDNGVIFNMMKEMNDSPDQSCCDVARMMEKTMEKSYTTTISFNRNTYILRVIGDGSD